MATPPAVQPFQAPKGVAEYVPPVADAFRHVRDTLESEARRAGYGSIELPVFEDTGLFVRGVGESTDVVTKEMYTFADRGGRSLTLRPEGTAGVMRAVIEHRLDRGSLPVKLCYAGPFFRAERPQQGRYRQFNQVGVEAIGSDDPALDAEVISVAHRAFARLGLRGYRLDVTSLGCAVCRPPYRALLQDFLRGLDLDEATVARVELNPLRVLDDKRPHVQEMVTAAPLMLDHLCPECADHFAAVRGYLDDLGVPYTINPRMVRGLDYYTRTTFEFVHPGLGAQSGIGGGGRYDGLMADLGGAGLSGIGFGIGTDRTLLACQVEDVLPPGLGSVTAFLVPMGQAARRAAVGLGGRLRAAGIATDMAYGGKGVKAAMKAANRSGAAFALILGDSELADGTVQVKDLTAGTQERIDRDAVVEHLRTVAAAAGDTPSLS